MNFVKRGPIAACLAILVAGAVLTGCAEFDRRGGLVAGFGDWALFPATTKSHRLLRAYLLTASLATVARNVGVGNGDRLNLSGRLRAVLEAEMEAYECLYPGRARLDWKELENVPSVSTLKVSAIQPSACVFFDERMARIDYALYKLAHEVLTDPDSQALFNDVRDRLVGGLPVVGAALRTVSKAVNTTKEAATTVVETTSLADSIINLSIRIAPRYVYLTPIYRDSLELDMRLVLDSLREACGDPRSTPGACDDTWQKGRALLAEGEGDLSQWRVFMDGIGATGLRVQAYPVHFAVVTRWLYYACSGIYAGTALTPGKIDKDSVSATIKVITAAVDDNCSPLIEFVPLSETPPFRKALRVAYTSKRTGKDKDDKPVQIDDDYDINANRAPQTPMRPSRVIDPEAAKAHGEADK